MAASNSKRWFKGYVRERNAARLQQYRPASAPALKRATRAVLAYLALSLGLAAMLFWLPAPAHAQGKPQATPPVPAEAMRYQLTLRREAQQAWGLGAPVATFAAQVHQESRWNPNARSGVGAQGLAQFMPATSNWIGGLYSSLGERAPNNPTWALRALVTYDLWLATRIKAVDDCQRMAFALSSYNGGLGWAFKRQKLALGQGMNPGVCLAATCTLNPGVTAASQRENEHYPLVILQRWEPIYATWGPGSCP